MLNDYLERINKELETRNIAEREDILNYLEEMILDREENGEETEAIIREIKDAFSQYQAPYKLSVSVGYDELTGENDPIRECIERADQKLYLSKKATQAT